MSTRVPMPFIAPQLTRDRRRGFTLPEILIVIVIISMVALVAIPRVSSTTGKRHMESSRMRIAAGLATARQAAIQRGQTVTFQIAAHRVRVIGAAPDTNLMSPVPLDTLYRVRTGGNVSIEFSSRGFANLVGPEKIILKRAGLADDSIVVTKTGMVQR